MGAFDIGKQCKAMGGANRLRIAPANRVPLHFFLADGFLSHHPTIHLIDWSEIWVRNRSRLKYREKAVNKNGFAINKSIEAFIAGTDNVMSIVNKMHGNEFIALVTDNNGNTRLVGSRSEPLSFSFQFDVKESITQVSGTKLIFEGLALNTSPIYQE